MHGPRFLVVGTPRSGTTLVQRLACELPGVAIGPETHFFRLFAAGLAQRRAFPLREPELRDELARFAALETSRGLALDADRVVAALGGRCETIVALFGVIVDELTHGAPLAGEKTPSHLLWWRPLTAASTGLRLVAVVRDPRGVVASYLTTWQRRQPALVAQRWAMDQREVAAARAALGDRCLVLRYEDVVADPGAARAAIGGLVGAAQVAAPFAARAENVPLGLAWETWKERASGPVTSERVEAWRDVLSEREAAIVAAVAAREMAQHGYGAPRGAGGLLVRLRPGVARERAAYRRHRLRAERRVRRVAAHPAFA